MLLGARCAAHGVSQPPSDADRNCEMITRTNEQTTLHGLFIWSRLRCRVLVSISSHHIFWVHHPHLVVALVVSESDSVELSFHHADVACSNFIVVVSVTGRRPPRLDPRVSSTGAPQGQYGAEQEGRLEALERIGTKLSNEQES